MPRTKHAFLFGLGTVVTAGTLAALLVIQDIGSFGFTQNANVIFATPKDSYSVVSDTNDADANERNEFIARVRSALVQNFVSETNQVDVADEVAETESQTTPPTPSVPTQIPGVVSPESAQVVPVTEEIAPVMQEVPVVSPTPDIVEPVIEPPVVPVDQNPVVMPVTENGSTTPPIE